MRENYRNSIASIKKFPQFTTMHVIDGQAGLIICASLIFCSLTIDNILNIIVLLILAGISISMLSGDNGLLTKAGDAKTQTGIGQEKETIALAYNSALAKKISNGNSSAVNASDMKVEFQNEGTKATAIDKTNNIEVTFNESNRQYTITSNGIIDYAGIKDETPASDGLEGLTDTEIAKLPTGVTEKTIENISNENLKDTSKIKAVITDNDNGEVPIPKGANYQEGTEKTGVVIEYKGSQFVWVPINSDLTVKGTTKLMAKLSTGDYAGKTNNLSNYEGVLYDFINCQVTGFNPETGPVWSVTAYEDPQPMSNYGQGSTDSSNGTIVNCEPEVNPFYDSDDLEYLKNTSGGDATLSKTYIETMGYETTALWKSELQGSYNAMIDSVKKYGGFYVGRYESSIDGNTVASVSGVLPMTAEANSGNMWYGMYKKQKDFSKDAKDAMQSSMIWGSQYDAMINWMLTGVEASKVNAATNGNHSGGIKNTGNTITDKINNIFDLEGNCYEWTAELNATSRIARGNYNNGSGLPATYRFGAGSNYKGNTFTSRITLYIK